MQFKRFVDLNFFEKTENKSRFVWEKRRFLDVSKNFVGFTNE